MRKWKVLLNAMTLFAIAAATAHAESLEGRLGVTGQLGFSTGQNSYYTKQFAAARGLSSSRLEPDGSFIGGGGVIYGLTRIVALEAGALYRPSTDFENSGAKALDISSTDAYLGFQIRNDVSADLAAYLGAGADILFSHVRDVNGNKGEVDTVVGAHVNVGGDYFITKSIALNLDLRALLFPDADIKSGSDTVAKYDPINFLGLFGVRFFMK